jgi:hypothetical protein
LCGGNIVSAFCRVDGKALLSFVDAKGFRHCREIDATHVFELQPKSASESQHCAGGSGGGSASALGSGAGVGVGASNGRGVEVDSHWWAPCNEVCMEEPAWRHTSSLEDRAACDLSKEVPLLLSGFPAFLKSENVHTMVDTVLRGDMSIEECMAFLDSRGSAGCRSLSKEEEDLCTIVEAHPTMTVQTGSLIGEWGNMSFDTAHRVSELLAEDGPSNAALIVFIQWKLWDAHVLTPSVLAASMLLGLEIVPNIHRAPGRAVETKTPLPGHHALLKGSFVFMCAVCDFKPRVISCLFPISVTCFRFRFE